MAAQTPQWDTTELDQAIEAMDAAHEKASSGLPEDVKESMAKTIQAADALRRTYKRMRGEPL